MFKRGIVTQINEKGCKVRVQLLDMDGILSYWLPVLQKKTLKDKSYWLPDINEQVVCLFDDQAEEGIVLGSIYSEVDKPPITDKDREHQLFGDGSIFEYDRKNKKLMISLKGEAEIVINETLRLKSKKTETTTEIELFSGDIMITGNVTVTGNVIAAGNISAAGAVSEGVGTLRALREAYESHIHPEHDFITDPNHITGLPM